MDSMIDRANDKVNAVIRRSAIIFWLITANDTYIDYQPINNSILIE